MDDVRKEAENLMKNEIKNDFKRSNTSNIRRSEINDKNKNIEKNSGKKLERPSNIPETGKSKSITRRIGNFFNDNNTNKDADNYKKISSINTKQKPAHSYGRTNTVNFGQMVTNIKPNNEKFEKSKEIDIIDMYKKKPSDESNVQNNSPKKNQQEKILRSKSIIESKPLVLEFSPKNIVKNTAWINSPQKKPPESILRKTKTTCIKLISENNTIPHSFYNLLGSTLKRNKKNYLDVSGLNTPMNCNSPGREIKTSIKENTQNSQRSILSISSQQRTLDIPVNKIYPLSNQSFDVLDCLCETPEKNAKNLHP